MSLRGLYDSELFETQQQGVGTVWLIATLGSRSNYRKIARKEIMTLSIPKVCKTISDPQRELALRLVSNLLYGIALVYKQQTEYCYTDTTIIRTRLSRDLYSRINVEKFIVPELIRIQGVDSHSNQQQQQQQQQASKILIHEDENFNIDIGLLPEFGADMMMTMNDINNGRNEIYINDIESEVISKQVQNFENIEIPDDLQMDIIDEDLVLDFGDLERRSSKVNSRQVTPFANVGDNDFLADFNIGEFGIDMNDINNEIQQEEQITGEGEEENQLNIVPDGNGPIEAGQIVQPLRKKRKIDVAIYEIQIDNPINITSAQLRDLNDDYVRNQVLDTSVKFRNEISKLDPSHCHSGTIEEFNKNYLIDKDYGFKMMRMNWDLNIDQMMITIDDSNNGRVGRERRSSSIASIERARRMSQLSQRSRSRSRSRSNSDFFNLQSQQDFMQGVEIGNDIELGQFDEIPYQEEYEHDQDTNLNEVVESLHSIKLEMVNKGKTPVIKFDSLIQINESRVKIVKLFTKLLECASNGDVSNLQNNPNGELEIYL